MSWSYVHASFLLNRFAVRGGATSFERSAGYRYSGKLAMFAEPVWGFQKGKAKGDRKWRRAMFLTKTPHNDMNVLMNEQGVWLTKSMRRNRKSWSDEKRLAEGGIGLPWDYHLGTLGSKVFPPSRNRVPIAEEQAGVTFETQGQLAGAIAGPESVEKLIPPPSGAAILPPPHVPAVPLSSMAGQADEAGTIKADVPGPSEAAHSLPKNIRLRIGGTPNQWTGGLRPANSSTGWSRHVRQ